MEEYERPWNAYPLVLPLSWQVELQRCTDLQTHHTALDYVRHVLAAPMRTCVWIRICTFKLRFRIDTFITEKEK